jgi:hypothetical protein
MVAEKAVAAQGWRLKHARAGWCCNGWAATDAVVAVGMCGTDAAAVTCIWRHYINRMLLFDVALMV